MLSEVAGYVSERVVGLFLTALVGVFVARYLGPSGVGLLSYAASVFGLLGPLTLLGMQSVLVREFSTRREWRSILSSALVSQVPLAAFASGVGFAVIVGTRSFDRQAVLLALVMLPTPLLGLSQSLRAYLEATGRVRQIVVTGIVSAVVASALRITGLLAGAPVWVFGAFGTAQAAVVLVGLAAAIPGRKRIASARRHVDTNTARRLVFESWPLLVASVAVTIYMQADIIMLGIVSGDEEAGIYTSAARLSEIWYLFPTAGLAAVRPRLSRLFASGDLPRYQRLTQRFMTAATGVSLLAIGVVLILADAIIRVLYGEAFRPAGPVLRLHVLAAPFVFLGVASSQWFIDRGRTRDLMVRTVIGAVVNVALNLALIPSHGALGAAIATMIAYALSSVFLNCVWRETRPLFRMQLSGFVFRWPPHPEGTTEETPSSGDSP